MKKSVFKVTDEFGKKQTWKFWRDTPRGYPPVWRLETHDGANRVLENNWQDSVPIIHRIAGNYNCTTTIN